MIELSVESAGPYLAARNDLPGGPWQVRSLGGGVSNTVLLAECGGSRLVLKQALAKLRVQEDWFADRVRIHRESSAMRSLEPLLPNGAVPRVLFEDRENYIFAMQAAPEPYAVDTDTLHLWHLDEVQNTNTTLPAFFVQDVSAQSFYDLDVVNGAKLEAPSFSVALGGALDNRGIPGALQYGAGALSEEDLFFHPDDFAGAGGEFTFEALVKPDFDPSTPDVTRPAMQILSLEKGT